MGNKARSTALKRLIDRNLTSQDSGNGGKNQIQAKRMEKKARRRARELKKQAKAGAKERSSSFPNSGEKLPIKSYNLELAEIESLKKEITKELDSKATYVKRQFRAEIPPGWEGLTPGLAPVGYDPDESDSDDPY